MSTVYRVEGAGGLGPYVMSWIPRKYKDDIWYALGYLHTDDGMVHPSPRQSFGGTPPTNVRYGFESMQMLFSWFAGYLPQLTEDGFKVAVYDNATVTHRDPDNWQCAFTGGTRREH